MSRFFIQSILLIASLATFSKQAEEKAKAQQQGSAFQPPSMERVKKQQVRLEEIIRSVEEDYPKGITQEELTPLFLEFHYTDSMKNINKVLANREAIMADPKKMKSWQEVSMMDILQVEGHLKNKFENTKTIDSKTAALMMKDDHWMMNMDEQTADDLNKFLELKYGKDLMMGDEGEEGEGQMEGHDDSEEHLAEVEKAHNEMNTPGKVQDMHQEDAASAIDDEEYDLDAPEEEEGQM